MKQKLCIFLVLVSFIPNIQSKGKGKIVTILHTNDTHSQLEPTAKGKGGIVNRAVIIDSIRQVDETVFLFDSGDFLQGTPYFNLYRGVAEVQLANELQIDAGTLGNHEFDNGTIALVELVKQLNYPILCSNLKAKGDRTKSMFHPYTIIQRNGVKIGVIGLVVRPNELISEQNFTHLDYLEPISIAEKTAKQLKVKEKCDLVICLSHLGYSYPKEPDKYSDIRLAQSTQYIDVILGGHTHTLLPKCDIKKGKNKHQVIINQAGLRGEHLGIIKITL